MTGIIYESPDGGITVRSRKMREFPPADSNVQAVQKILQSRMEAGYIKYGTTTERVDVDLLGWLQHLQEELLDAAVYVQRLKGEINMAKESDLTARVFQQHSIWGVKFYKSGELVATEMYPDHGKLWADSCADNYIKGVRKINELK